MAPKKTPSPTVPFWKTVEDMIGQQVGHAAGKGLSHSHIVTLLVSMMNDQVLGALRLAGPSLTAGVGKTAFQVLKGRIPVLKNLADPVLEEAMEGLLNGFFSHLAKFPGATDAQARMALLAAANESMIAHAPVSGGAVKPGSFVLSDAVLKALEEKYDEDSVREILAWYCHGVSCLARAALDMNVQDSLAVEAGMAFNHGDFSSVVSVITFVETAKKHQGSFENLVYACAAVVQANTAADHSGMRTTFMARRLLARGLNWLGVNGTRQNFMNVLGNWIAPGLLKDGQFVAFLVALWVACYVTTAVPWFYAARAGSFVGMFILAALNLIVTQFTLKVLGLVVGVHSSLYRGVLHFLGQKEEGGGDKLPALQSLRAQASSPLLVATVLNAILILLLGETPRAFNFAIMILMATVSVGILISIWDMAKTSHAKFFLDAGIKYLLPVLLASMAWDVYDAFTQSQLPGKGMRLMGNVHEFWGWATSFSMGQVVTGGLTILLVAAVAFALKQGKVWHAIALVVIAVPLSWIVDCSVSAPKRAEAAQEQRAQEHALQLETLRLQRQVAEAGKTVIVVGDPVLAMRQLGGPTRKADIALRVPRESSAATEREEIQIEDEEEWEEDLDMFVPEKPNIREILREREERAQRTVHHRPRPSSRRTSAHHHRAQRNARR
ncbi:hypothetical protein COV06_03285 [Candidatus Uhrbacteria bacterium CG10_big_fil_rev_8_21_14_0_10_50_16]|uniref:Uncharacterized protein n=1 Tax=Candidatus Uhrbacteria bacterium CG10_big_fil_rev_8_21_14_0_10_50_16 TaxID=1975039 RepID=A0A2H0RNW1_9BACT|nr:MAG: hypothetical protein COV06_03285 [Candidatus Uhrbacteria bacterium CG10_big_fil_rev_8_21_14_0_10_50_16]